MFGFVYFLPSDKGLDSWGNDWRGVYLQEARKGIQVSLFQSQGRSD